MKRLAHQGRANLGISTAGSLGVGCLPDVDLNLLEGLKCCNVVVTATKQRDDFFGEQRGQKIVGKNAGLAVRVHISAGAQALCATCRHIEAR